MPLSTCFDTFKACRDWWHDKDDNNHEQHELNKWEALTTFKPVYGFELDL